MIAPSSIPVFGAESIVNAKLLQLLTSNDFEIDLISKKSKWEHYPGDQNLQELNIELRKINIVEVDNKINLKTLQQHLMAFLTFGTVFKGAHWAYLVTRRLKNTIERNEYDFILTKNSPSLLVGYYFKKKYGYKWVASWNDPYPKIKYPAPYGKGVRAKLPWYQKKVLKIMEKADQHIFPSNRLKNYMRQYIEIDEHKTLIAPHIVFKKNSNSRTRSETLKILHSGNLTWPRDPKPLILGIQKLLQVIPDLAIKFDFIGVFDNDLEEFVKQKKLSKVIGLLAPIRYNDNLELLSDYDLSVIIEADCEEGIFLPTKVGDYMQSNTPIFTISPENGVLNDLYQKGFVQYFSSNNSEAIYLELKKIYSDFLQHGLKESKFYEPYNAENILKSYSSI